MKHSQQRIDKKEARRICSLLKGDGYSAGYIGGAKVEVSQYIDGVYCRFVISVMDGRTNMYVVYVEGNKTFKSGLTITRLFKKTLPALMKKYAISCIRANAGKTLRSKKLNGFKTW